MAKTLIEIGEISISELINSNISIFKPEDTVSKVIGELEENGSYEAIVSTGSKMGLITIRDLLDVEQPEHTKIEKLWRVITPISNEKDVKSVATTFLKQKIRALPVADGLKPIGIVSQVDIMESIADCLELKNTKAINLAVLEPTTIDVETKISEARKIMLTKGFSHLPILKNGKIVGIIRAHDIVQIFITTMGRNKVGLRLGEKISRFPGAVSGIMDKNPLIFDVDASAYEVAKGMRDNKKSACLIVNQSNSINGILTPYEFLPLIAETTTKPELPISIIGLDEEDFFEKDLAEEKVRRAVSKGIKMHPNISEISVKIKKTDKNSEKIRYQIVAKIISPHNQWNVKSEGWDLLETFDDLIDDISRLFLKMKKEINKVPKRGRGRE